MPHAESGGDEAQVLRDLYQRWVSGQRINSARRYVLPLRVAVETLIRDYTGGNRWLRNEAAVLAWGTLTDAVNDPAAGVEIVRLPYRRVA